MPAAFEPRLAELRVLQNLTDGTWGQGVCLTPGDGQAEGLMLSHRMYADLLLTLIEDGLLNPESDGLRNLITNYEKWTKNASGRRQLVLEIAVSQVWDVTVTYRGLRHIEQLREQLRRDRILEKFGILLDGRYIVSDLNYFLERTNGEPVSLILADVDDFKQFNTNHGYKAGDEVLRQVFRIARQIVGDKGDVYRQGGEEIVALLPYCNGNASADLAEKIRQSVDNTQISFAEKSLHATLSIGVATSPPCDPDGPALEAHTEIALRRAKDEGKNCVRLAE